MDFDGLVLQPIYTNMGRAAVLLTRSGDEHNVVVMPKLSGVEVTVNEFSVPTVVPAADIRMVALTDADVVIADLRDGQLTFDDTRWRIRSTLKKPSPNGDSDGEVRLLLEEEKRTDA